MCFEIESVLQSADTVKCWLQIDTYETCNISRVILFWENLDNLAHHLGKWLFWAICPMNKLFLNLSSEKCGQDVNTDLMPHKISYMKLSLISYRMPQTNLGLVQSDIENFVKERKLLCRCNKYFLLLQDAMNYHLSPVSQTCIMQNSSHLHNDGDGSCICLYFPCSLGSDLENNGGSRWVKNKIKGISLKPSQI